jgi:hypothetical protein
VSISKWLLNFNKRNSGFLKRINKGIKSNGKGSEIGTVGSGLNVMNLFAIVTGEAIGEESED